MPLHLPLPITIAIRLAGCCAIAWLAWRWFGASGLVYSAPLFGIALARPLVDAVSACFGLARRLAIGDVEGRHYAYRGTRIDVIEDADHVRWLRTGDVRRVIEALPRDAVLERLYPHGIRIDSPRHGARISAEAMADYLATSTAPNARRLARWLERDVAYAARRLRERS